VQITSNLAVKRELHAWDECIYRSSLYLFKATLELRRRPTDEAGLKSAFLSLPLNKQSRGHSQSRLLLKPPADIGPSLCKISHKKLRSKLAKVVLRTARVLSFAFIRLWGHLARSQGRAM
jgi:hypothetical protein